jgi:hypothetical protein
MSNLKVNVTIPNHEPVSIIIPAESVISTSLVVSESNVSLPTLTSVERIVSRVGSLGISVADPASLEKLAAIVNAHYLTVSPADWVETAVPIRGELPGTPPDTKSFRAVQTIRPPILKAADTILRTNPEVGGRDRRAEEVSFLESLNSAIRCERSVWESWPARVAVYITKTTLDAIVRQLIGVPLRDVASHALAGLNRII